MGYRLGVDLGTTFTAAAVDGGTGPSMLGLGNRALAVPSVVFLTSDGRFLFGEAAERRAASEPSRSAREFKRRIGDTVPILLAGQPFSPQSLSAKLLAWVVSVATERQGAAPDQVVATYPANWGGYKRELLHQLVTLAEVPDPLTCTEPEAAATQYTARAGLSAGDKVAVYDLGGGTFDVCILEKQEQGFAIIGSPDGVEHLGGIDFDEAVFQHVVGMLPDRMAGLDFDDPEVTTGLARLRRECVEAKEALSSDVEATISVTLPGLSTSLRMTRSELEGLITSPLRDTLDATSRALRSAGLTAADLATVVLVGGSSRIPLVSHLLQNEFGVRTAMDTHPKHDIALGAVQYHPSATGEAAPPAAPTVAQWPARARRTAESSPAPPPPPTSPTPGPIEPAEPEPEPTVPLPAAPAPAEAAKAKRPGPPVWHPPDQDAAAGGRPSGPTIGDRSVRLTSRPVLLGVAATVALLIVGASAYALTRGDPDEAGTGGGPSPTTGVTPAGRVFPEDVLLVSIQEDESADPEVHAISTATGEDLGPATPASGQSRTPWVTRDGAFVGYREAPPGSGPEGPWTIMMMNADREATPLFSSPPQDIECLMRVAWDPTGDRIVVQCLQDADGDGEPEASLYVGPVQEDGRVDGAQLEQFLTPDSPTETSPDGSPGSLLRRVSFLPSGDVPVTYSGGEEPGVHVVDADGSSRRLTSGEFDEYAIASPTAELVAFVRDGDLYVASADGTPPPCPGRRRELTDEVTGAALCNLTRHQTSVPDQAAIEPVWSWDGQTIAIQIGSESNDVHTLHLVDLETAGPVRTLLSEPRIMGSQAWGPR